MSIFINLASAAASLAWHAAVAELTRQAARLLPFLQTLEEGGVAIPQNVIQRLVNLGVSGYDEIENLKIECQEGVIVACAECKKVFAKYNIRFTFTIVELVIRKDRQVAQFRVCEDFDVEGRNLIGKASVGIAYSIISGAVQSDESMASILEKTDGVVELAWPNIIVHLDRHPVLEKVNRFNINNVGVWDIAEITGCNVEPGHIVLGLLKHEFGEPATSQA